MVKENPWGGLPLKNCQCTNIYVIGSGNTITSDSFNNKGNGHQHFSSASILASKNQSLSYVDASGRRNQTLHSDAHSGRNRRIHGGTRDGLLRSSGDDNKGVKLFDTFPSSPPHLSFLPLPSPTFQHSSAIRHPRLDSSADEDSDLKFDFLDALVWDLDLKNSNTGTEEDVHVHLLLRDGGFLTVVQGLKKECDYYKILKDLKEKCCCDGSVVEHPKFGQVIQLQGNKRQEVFIYLVKAGIVKKELIKIHA